MAEWSVRPRRRTLGGKRRLGIQEMSMRRIRCDEEAARGWGGGSQGGDVLNNQTERSWGLRGEREHGLPGRDNPRLELESLWVQEGKSLRV